VLHARNRARTESAAGFGETAVVVGDLASQKETIAVAEQANAIGGLDAVVHNAGVYDAQRVPTPEGHSRDLAVNVIAPYLLTVLIGDPSRLVYISSDMHPAGDHSMRDIDWLSRPWRAAQAYSDSKLFVTALALAVARRRREVFSNAVDPGWVRTKMGGPGAPGDLRSGSDTQAWLAAGDDPATEVTGGYWHRRRRQNPAAAAADEQFQDALLNVLARLTGVSPP
jgi:NAD(P)-dependent dehydrogenase (short-subunit alcohol dehydrogenase family)